MSPATALLLHGFTSGPASMWRFQEWLAELGYQAEARAQLGHGGRGPATDYSLAALAADNLAMGDHDLVVGHSMGGATATLAAARRPEWAGQLVLVDPAWRFTTADEAAAVKREELAALDRDAGEIRVRVLGVGRARRRGEDTGGRARLAAGRRGDHRREPGREPAGRGAVAGGAHAGDLRRPGGRRGRYPRRRRRRGVRQPERAPRADRRGRPQPAPRRPGSRPAGPPRLARSSALASQPGTSYRKRSSASRGVRHGPPELRSQSATAPIVPRTVPGRPRQVPRLRQEPRGDTPGSPHRSPHKSGIPAAAPNRVTGGAPGSFGPVGRPSALTWSGQS